MKKCPACEKTFEDSMRFCQIDGTPLVDDTSFDPFATIVGVAPPVQETEPSQPSSSFEPPTDDAPAISEPDDVLDLPDADPLKTMYVSDDEMKAALQPDSITPEPGIVELPPIEDSSTAETIVNESSPRIDAFERSPSMPEPEPPNFSVPDVPAPIFGEKSPPPSPFSTGSSGDVPVSAPTFEEPVAEKKTFNEAETIIQGDYSNPFEAPPAAPVAEWTPPASSEPSWQNQQSESNMPFQPAAAPMAAGQNKTLAIISLVTGILGVTICCGGLLPSIAAIITGVMARNKANQNPSEFGGAGMALAGIITGVVGLLGGVVVMIFWLLGTFANFATGNF